MNVYSLRCEYLTNPIDIDVINPRLSWIVESDARGDKQTAYQILVASSEDLLDEETADLWNTGKFSSSKTIHVQYQGEAFKSGKACFWKVRVWDADDIVSDWSEVATWSMGLLEPSDWHAKWIGSPPRKKRRLRAGVKEQIDPSPLIRKTFSLDKPARRAMMYVTALGEYEASINGHHVGDHVLAPEYTDYYKHVQYQGYDVTNLVQKGENAIGVTLGDGWYIGNHGFGNVKLFMRSRLYGIDRRLLIQLAIEFDDGSQQLVCSGPDWKIWEDGPIQRADHYLGEIYDCRKELPGWNAPDFDDSIWTPVTVDDNVQVTLVAQMNEPIRVVKEIKPISMREPKPGVFLFDLGQNIAGWCKLHLTEATCDANAIVKVRHGEMLDLDGNLYTTNLAVAKAEDIYHLDQCGDLEIHPHFTYHGFQYIEVTGLKPGITPSLELVTGCAVSSDTPAISAFECSDPSLNQLWRNIIWTLRDNLISIPTDCPQRSERLGWMGDAQVFNQTSMYIMQMAGFYTKWMKDVRDAQLIDGRFSDVSPNPFIRGGIFFNLFRLRGAPAWADAGVSIPWNMYVNYADIRELEIHYDAAKKYVDQLYASNPGLLWKRDKGFIDFGDWLNGDKINAKDYPHKGGAIPKIIHATAFFGHSVELVSKMANLLGKTDDAKIYSDLAKQIKKVFCTTFVDTSGRIKGDTQAGYALALNFDILPDDMKENATRHMIEAIARYDNRLSTGFTTTTRMMLELARSGHVNIAYNLLFSRRFPSWFYMIDQGATTMWERWDGFVKGRGFQNKFMNSFNHYAYGSIGEFIYRVILGINLDELRPCYEHFILRPMPGGPLSRVKGALDTIRGRIECEWRFNGGIFDLDILVPANSTATVYIPANDESAITESGKRIENTQWITVVGHEDGIVRLEVESGSYHFKSTKISQE